MEVIKPSWVKHHDDKNRRQCIFSSDIDVEGIRCATGGMDGVIRIWRVAGLFEGAEEQKSGNLLASMSRHNGSVLCVRWSSQGLLASSSDDTIILIWQLDSRPASMRGNLEGLNDEGEVLENYKVVKRLIGHQSDTVGVEWSPDGRVLASCSLDGTICFWNSDLNSSQTLIGKIERAHSGFIKGLAWDPAGKFLASQSDDGSCIVWNVESLLKSQASATAFNLDPSDCEMFKETVLEKIFVNMSKMTFFHRPCWSPDGSLLALANATNRQIPAVALVERSNWHGPGTFFVGHLGPVEAVRFNPRLFTHCKSGSSERKEMLCAVASQDGQVSIWSSSSTRPLLVLQDLFEHSVMDLTWTPDGSILVAVSYDGAAVAVRIDPQEFELIPLSQAEQAEHLKNVFGNRSNFNGDTSQGYVESVKVIECLRENEQFLSNHPQLEMKPEIERAASPMSRHINKIGTETESESPFPQPTTNVINNNLSNNINTFNVPVIVNGKKRITPQLVNLSGTLQQQQHSLGSSSQSQPRSGVRLRDEDFLIHRKLLERTGNLLISKSARESNAPVFQLSEEFSTSNISVPLSTGIFSVSLEITNHDLNGRKPSSLVQFIQNCQIIWKERIRGTIYCASATRKFSCFAIQNEQKVNSLLVLTASGRRYLPPISLDSPAVHLKLNPHQNHLTVIIQNGTILIWNLLETKLIFSDSSLSFDIPMKFVSFQEDQFKITVSSVGGQVKNLHYNPHLGIWTAEVITIPVHEDVKSEFDRVRIEKLKVSLLSAPETGMDRQISELEFELSLIFVNLRNGKQLNSSEMAHFERTLAIYALKLAKEGKTFKARELIEDLKELKLDELVEGLLKPFLATCQTSSWQDFLTQTL